MVRLGEKIRRLLERAVHVAVDTALPAGLEGLCEPKGEICFSLVDDEEMAALNETYLGKAGPTDVLAFPMAPGPEEPQIQNGPEAELEIFGDVVISVQTAQVQASEQGHSLEKELALLAVHGVLHLMGFRDEDPEQAAVMRTLEDKSLDALGF